MRSQLIVLLITAVASFAQDAKIDELRVLEESGSEAAVIWELRQTAWVKQ